MGPSGEQFATWWADRPEFAVVLFLLIGSGAVIACLFWLLIKEKDKVHDRAAETAEALKDTSHVLETLVGKTEGATVEITREVKDEGERTRTDIGHKIDRLKDKIT